MQAWAHAAVPVQIPGEGFVLRRWQVTDAAWYVAARDEEIFRWTTEKQDLTVAETEEAIRRINAGADALCFAIADAENGALLGNIALTSYADHNTAEVMYWLAPEARGRGIATRAVMQLCAWAFAAGCERITCKTMRNNVRSQRVAERAGFHRLAEEREGESNADYQWYERRAGE